MHQCQMSDINIGLTLPITVLVLGTTRHQLSADQSCRLPATVVTVMQLSARYGGASPCMHLPMIVVIR